jgi:hypothetical protein
MMTTATQNARHQVRRAAGARQLGRRKARCIAVRFLTPPVENRTYHFHGMRLHTCDPSPWLTLKRRCPFRPFHRYAPVSSLCVHGGPLFPSSHRLGAYSTPKLPLIP